jgi:alkylation response protein AidB-like acyl-CoA dehydrogenase
LGVCRPQSHSRPHVCLTDHQEEALFNLQLNAEQLEFRDTVRDFVQNEVKPAAIHPDRLQPFDKPLLADLLDNASRMGLRTLSLSEDAGGAGADALTNCIVLEELAVGDVDLAAVIACTSSLAGGLNEAMSAEQRTRFLAGLAEDAEYHLALVAHDYDMDRAWQYHRAAADEPAGEPAATRQSNGEWLIEGDVASVANAPVAKLFIVQARTDSKKTGPNGLTTFLVPRDAAGLTVGEPIHALGERGAAGAERVRWHHGTSASVSFRKCKVAANQVLGKEGQAPFARPAYTARRAVHTAAVNLGLGRGAYETAVDYTKMRVQGGRHIVEHQAIGRILADLTMKIELARNAIWKAAWVLDHPEAISDRSVADLPWHTIARVYTAEAMHDVALGAAECFGAMGVMRDMPLQKYVHDAMVFLHAADHDTATKLGIAEAAAGFERPRAAA